VEAAAALVNMVNYLQISYLCEQFKGDLHPTSPISKLWIDLRISRSI